MPAALVTLGLEDQNLLLRAVQKCGCLLAERRVLAENLRLPYGADLLAVDFPSGPRARRAGGLPRTTADEPAADAEVADLVAWAALLRDADLLLSQVRPGYLHYGPDSLA